MTDFISGIGTAPSWGLSPARCFTSLPGIDPTIPCKIVALGAGNIGHILYTSATSKSTAELFVAYDDTESLARDLLLLSIAMDTDIAETERSELFLECFANLMLREKTDAYLGQQTQKLIQNISNCIENPGDRFFSLVDLNNLKFKELDDLKSSLKSINDPPKCDIENLRDHRLRSYYAERYDVRQNLVDWDFVMNLKKKAMIVNKLHFTQWRMTGQAFEVRDSKYTIPNKTLLTYRNAKQKSNGKSVRVLGYWGDIIVSPYISFGVEAPNAPELFQVQGDRYQHSAVDVSKHNIQEVFKYMRSELPHSTVKIVPIMGLDRLTSKSKFRNAFDLVYMPIQSSKDMADPVLKLLLKPGGRVAVESFDFIASMPEKQRSLYNNKIKQLAIAAKFEECPTDNSTEHQLYFTI
uniref:Dynein assembly factor 3, axonemal homolog n=1 Tax=Spongospora subterranea TaxID=70186 RepID=A0A0H5RDL4_9EUKA|eukprot:CRZ11841.1 hypothetical protein [Spongospora subterranea]